MMSKSISFNRSAQLFPFLELFKRRGGDVAPLLQRVGLEKLDLKDPSALIAGKALYRAIQAMTDELGDPFFAAEAMVEFVKDGPIFVRESFKASHTLAEFLPLAIIEIERQSSSVRYTLIVNSDSTVIRVERAISTADATASVDAAAVMVWVTLLREAVGDVFDPARLIVRAQSFDGLPRKFVPKRSRMLSDLNGVSVAFPSEWLTCPLNLGWHFSKVERGEFSNETARDAIVNFAARLCRQNLSDKSFGIEAFADYLGTNSRGIQRSFEQLGLTFQDIRDDVRRETAMTLVKKDPALTNEAIAEALGFSGATSFSRAFKRWTGRTVAEFRRAR